MAARRGSSKSGARATAGARRSQGVLERAGLAPGRGALLSSILMLFVGIGLYAWSQTPWTGAIDAKEWEWKITLSADRHVAGDVTFDLSNRGTISHEFLVVATEKTAAELLDEVDPATNRIDEALLDVVDEQPEYDAATTAELTVTLPEGHYVVMCNIEGHYASGMYADLTITPAADGRVVTRTPAPEPEPAIGTVESVVKEWEVALASDLHVSGSVPFKIANEGSIAHEFLIVRSEKRASELLADVDPATGRIDEALIEVVDEQPEFEPGAPGAVTVDLSPGHYVVMCNIAGHFQAGMYADLEIVPAPVSTNGITGDEAEWHITLDSYTHASGPITFNLTNSGTIAHEFLIVRSDAYANQLLASVDPTTKRIDEALLEVIDEQPEYEPGTPGSVTVDLSAGHYVVMCNIEGHYKAGMYADFDVVDN